ncbi:MAG TPA: PAS domain-containing protein [Pyrinomonadaceae bacterium]|nr:PAS domain-containing protein [Pyrinomonadaceae bacterium]
MKDNEISTIPFGMLELDATGTIVHYSPATEERRAELAGKVVGRNFFEDFFSAAQVQNFKSRFHAFMADGASVDRFTLIFPYREESIKIQVVMAHLSEKTERGHERFALIRLMPEADVPASSFVSA